MDDGRSQINSMANDLEMIDVLLQVVQLMVYVGRYDEACQQAERLTSRLRRVAKAER